MCSILEANNFGSTVAKGVNRPLSDYLEYLGPRFAKRLLAATSATHFLDFGGGNGVASRELAEGGFACSASDPKPLRDLAARKKKDRPKVTLVSFKTDAIEW